MTTQAVPDFHQHTSHRVVGRVSKLKAEIQLAGSTFTFALNFPVHR